MKREAKGKKATLAQHAVALGMEVEALIEELDQAAIDLTNHNPDRVLLPTERKSIDRYIRLKTGEKMTPKLTFRSIELTAIRSFTSRFRADFADENRLFTVSGANGSGKSTIMRALVLLQKAFFADQLIDGSPLWKRYAAPARDEILKTLRHKDSRIRAVLTIDKVECTLSLESDNNDRGWKLVCSEHDLLRKTWNMDRPTAIILYLDAGKSVLEDEVRYTKLDAPESTRTDVAIRCIFDPQHAFSEMYKTIVQDYVVERLIPNTPPRILYQNVTRTFFEELIQNIEISNFSSRHDQQVALFARRRGTKPTYDVRDLSSGEKTLYFTLAYLFLADTVGTLVIDEPENHFHENLLLRVMTFLDKILNSGDLPKLIVEQDSRGSRRKRKLDEVDENKKQEKYEEMLRKVYSNHRLSQVFLLTHSQTLIYHVFSLGKNYTIGNEPTLPSWDELTEASAEKALREIGLSTTYSRILFVEGEGDQSVLEYLLSDLKVIVRPLGGSNAVKDMFKRLATVRDGIRGMQVVFLVDEDAKPSEFFAGLRKHNQTFFDETFVVLNRHEIENYFLDENLMHQTLRRERGIQKTAPAWQKSSIRQLIVETARSSLNSSCEKAAKAQLAQTVGNLIEDRLIGDMNANYSIKGVAHIEKVLTDNFLDELRDKAVRDVNRVIPRFSNLDDQTAVDRCDGKSVFKQVAAKLLAGYGINKDRFASQIADYAALDVSSGLGGVINHIRTRFQG